MLSKTERQNVHDWKQFQDLWKNKNPDSWQKIHLYVQDFEKSRDRWMQREGVEYEDKCYDLHNAINNTEVSMPSTQHQVKTWSTRESAANMREFRAQPTRHITAGERKHRTASEKVLSTNTAVSVCGPGNCLVQNTSSRNPSISSTLRITICCFGHRPNVS